MASNLFTKVTAGIRVNVRTVYVPDESSPKHDYYVFSYEVEIVNESSFEVQVLRRSWTIIDALGDIRSVAGPGVVGKQPHIAPGEAHRYTSGCHFPTPIGKMLGTYTVVRCEDRIEFEVEIPAFNMMVPYLNN